MTSINSSSSSNSTNKAYSSAGLSGLVSGLDTETMVKQMLSATQRKIDNQKALKQQLLWKQDAYRDIISSFHSLQNKYFNYLSPKTNLLSTSFFNSKAVTSSSSAVRVTPLGDVLSNKVIIDSIQSLATARKETSANAISNNVTLNIDPSNFENATDLKLNITLDGVTKEIILSDAEVAGPGDQRYGEGTKEAIIQNLNNSIKKAFGSGVSVDVSTGEIIVSNSSRQVTLSGGTDVQNIMGFKGNVSNKISLSSSLKDLNLQTPIAGSKQKFTINGVEFEIDSTASFTDVMRQINASNAGVKVSYSSISDKFTIESTTTGQGITFDMTQSEGNLLTIMFGVPSASKVTSNSVYTNIVSATNDVDLGDLREGTFKFKIDGTVYSIALDKLSDEENPYSLESLTDNLNQKLNDLLKDTYGEDTFAFVVDQMSGKVNLYVSNRFEVEIESSEGSLSEKLGFSDNAKNEATADSTLDSIGLVGTIKINGVEVTLDGTKKISDLSIYGFSFNEGKLSISNDTPSFTVTSQDDFMTRMFNSSVLVLNSAAVANTVVEHGKNAVLSVNGQTIERNTNNFSIDGFQVTLVQETNEAITLTAENNTDQIFDGIVQFINEYNSLIEKINSQISAKPTYRDYPPLTDDQKTEMSDKEIELWEEKSKQGLLSGDTTLNSILSQMRTLMYTKPEGSSVALYTIGITTSTNYLDKGKLVIDEDKLRAAIEKDTDAISKLFTDKEGGLAVSLNKLIDGAAKSSVVSPGTLVELAGVKNTVSETKNSLYKRMQDIEKMITQLKKRYESEKARYWKQFTSLEKVISQTNSQSSWLSSMFYSN